MIKDIEILQYYNLKLPEQRLVILQGIPTSLGKVRVFYEFFTFSSSKSWNFDLVALVEDIFRKKYLARFLIYIKTNFRLDFILVSDQI